MDIFLPFNVVGLKTVGCLLPSTVGGVDVPLPVFRFFSITLNFVVCVRGKNVR